LLGTSEKENVQEPCVDSGKSHRRLQNQGEKEHEPYIRHGKGEVKCPQTFLAENIPGPGII